MDSCNDEKSFEVRQVFCLFVCLFVCFASQGNLIVKNIAFQVSYPGKYVFETCQ